MRCLRLDKDAGNRGRGACMRLIVIINIVFFSAAYGFFSRVVIYLSDSTPWKNDSAARMEIYEYNIVVIILLHSLRAPRRTLGEQ